MAENSRVETANLVVTESDQPELVEAAEEDSGKKYPVALDDPYKKAISYLEEHHIIQIFQVLTTGIVCERPDDPLDYMIEQVDKLQNEERFQLKKQEEEEY